MIRRVLRLVRFEWRKLLARRLTLAAFALVVLVALVSPWAGQVVDTAAALSGAKPGGGAGASAFHNGWVSLASSVQTARLFLVLALLVLAASAVAEEYGYGTLQALLVRPLQRTDLLLAKALAVWSYGVALLLVALGAAALGAELTEGLYDVVERGSLAPPKYTFGQMWDFTFLAAALTALALAALTALGLFASVLFEHPGHATGVALGAWFLLSAAAGLSEDAAPWVFVHHLTTPFALIGDLAQQYTGTIAKLAPPEVARAAGVCVGWTVAFLGASALVLRRKDITARGG